MFISHRQLRIFLETLYKATYTGYFKWSLHLASSLTSLATTTKKRQGGCRHFSIDNFRIQHSMLCGKHRLLLQGKDTLKTKGLLTKKPKWKECENIGEMIFSIYIYIYKHIYIYLHICTSSVQKDRIVFWGWYRWFSFYNYIHQRYFQVTHVSPCDVRLRWPRP